MRKVRRRKRRWLAGGIVALVCCYIAPGDYQRALAYYQSTNPVASTQPLETSTPLEAVLKPDDTYPGFHFSIVDQLGKDELSERVVARVMATDGSDQIIELDLDKNWPGRSDSYRERATASPPPASKHFDIELAVDYVLKNHDGTPGEPVHWANTLSMDVANAAYLPVTIQKDGSFSLQPIPGK